MSTLASPPLHSLDLLEGLGEAPTPAACFERIAAQARAIGFEFCAHGMRMPVPITRPRTTLHSNYPAAWQRRYEEQGYLEIDPTVAHAMRSSAPIVWNDALFAATPEFWRDAQAHGLRHGWAQSRRDPEGTYSMLTLARREGPLEAEELARLQPTMQWLVHASHEAMKSAGQAPRLDQVPEALTPREIEVLRWTAEGKTSGEVADILRISERTVNFHVSGVVLKLGACNKISAVARAAMLGLLW